jgi:hypothetical protein
MPAHRGTRRFSEWRFQAGSAVIAQYRPEQLDPAVIAVSEVRQLPGIIGQGSDPLEHPAQASLELRRDRCIRFVAAQQTNAETSARPERDNRWKPRNRRRLDTSAAESPAERRAHIFLNRASFRDHGDMQTRSSTRRCCSGNDCCAPERELAMSLDKTKMLPERSGHLIEPGLFFAVKGHSSSMVRQRLIPRSAASIAIVQFTPFPIGLRSIQSVSKDRRALRYLSLAGQHVGLGHHRTPLQARELPRGLHVRSVVANDLHFPESLSGQHFPETQSHCQSGLSRDGGSRIPSADILRAGLRRHKQEWPCAAASETSCPSATGNSRSDGNGPGKAPLRSASWKVDLRMESDAAPCNASPNQDREGLAA